MPESLRFGAVILAAGASTRMGSPKQLLLVGGHPLIVCAIEAALASAARPVVVVLGAEADRIRKILAPYGVLIAENPTWADGMASSIRAGVSLIAEHSPPLDAVVIALCDQPAFSADSIGRLVAAQRATGRSIAAARYRGRNGAPAFFLRAHFPTLCALDGDRGARAILNENLENVASVDMPELEADIDTPLDYAAAVRLGANRHPPAAGQ